MTQVIQKYELTHFYTLTYGAGNDIYQFDNKTIWSSLIHIKKNYAIRTTFKVLNTDDKVRVVVPLFITDKLIKLSGVFIGVTT